MTRKVRGQGRLSNRQKTWLWIFATTAVVVGLLYWEQIPLLYVLGTVSVSVLLVVVALSDLGGARASVSTVATNNDSLSIENAAAVAPPASTSTFGSPPRKRRG